MELLTFFLEYQATPSSQPSVFNSMLNDPNMP